MTNIENIEKYNKSFEDTFLIDGDKIETLEYQSIEAWDSVGHMSLMASLEEVFNIEMEIDDIIEFSSYEVGKMILKKYNIEI